tara:strand:- start:173 stop:520 length:348 start_codon:yes stop_codon:yes gene_type:complete
MSIYVRNLSINTHSDFSEDLELFQSNSIDRVNLTGHTAQSQMRKHPDSSTAHDFTVGITSAADGKITLSMTDDTTADIKPGRYMYDILLTKPSGDKEIALEGMVIVRPGISTNCP